MRHLLSLAVIAVSVALMSTLAHAGWNIRQNADGSTVWVDDSGETVPVGSNGLSVRITDVSTAATYFVISARDGKIAQVYAVIDQALAANSNAPDISIGTGPGNSVGTFTPISLGAAANSPDHLTLVTTVAGAVVSFTPADNAVDVSQGGVISVNTNGDGTSAVGANVIIIIE